MIKRTINKEQFIRVYNKNKPNGFVKFIYKYFSQGTEGEVLKVKNTFGITLMVLFLVGFLGTIFELPKEFVLYPTLMFTGLLFLFGILGFIAYKMNQFRLKRIAEFLDINMEEYNQYWEMYLKKK